MSAPQLLCSILECSIMLTIYGPDQIYFPFSLWMQICLLKILFLEKNMQQILWEIITIFYKLTCIKMLFTKCKLFNIFICYNIYIHILSYSFPSWIFYIVSTSLSTTNFIKNKNEKQTKFIKIKNAKASF